MEYITDIAALEAIYGKPGAASLRKVAHRLTPGYREWIMASRFCVISTVGADGTDGSPRGDDGPVAHELDEHTLAIPDWRGNNRMDTLRNIVEDERISVMFMISGADTVIRLNGAARVSVDPKLLAKFSDRGREPRSVIVIRIGEIYSQCSRAPMRAELWGAGDQSAGLPTVGDILAELTDGEVGGAAYDDSWAERAAKTMW